jgi:molybdopterin/thiamine biosynthesis adenylyltransferase
MNKETQHARFSDAPWYNKDITEHVIVGGAGGIGSWTTLLLARAGFKPIVYDFDDLEEVNMAGQLYPSKSIGSPKVIALHSMVSDFADTLIIPMNEHLNENSMTHKYVIAAFDNMLARKTMFDLWTADPINMNGGLFIDGRLNAEHLWIYCVPYEAPSIDAYRDCLFDDKELADQACTFKQTSHTAAMIAGHIVAFLTNHITNVRKNDDDRSVPFCWEYNIPLDLLTVTNQPQQIDQNGASININSEGDRADLQIEAIC